MAQVPQAEGVPIGVQGPVKVLIAVRRLEGHGVNGVLGAVGEILKHLVEGRPVQLHGTARSRADGNGILGAVFVNDNPQRALGLIVLVVVCGKGNLQDLAILGGGPGQENEVVQGIITVAAALVIEILPAQLPFVKVGVAHGPDFAGKAGVIVAGVKLHPANLV